MSKYDFKSLPKNCQVVNVGTAQCQDLITRQNILWISEGQAFYTFYLIGPIIVATPNKAENLNEKFCAINYVLPFRTKISEIVD